MKYLLFSLLLLSACSRPSVSSTLEDIATKSTLKIERRNPILTDTFLYRQRVTWDDNTPASEIPLVPLTQGASPTDTSHYQYVATWYDTPPKLVTYAIPLVPKHNFQLWRNNQLILEMDYEDTIKVTSYVPMDSAAQFFIQELKKLHHVHKK